MNKTLVTSGSKLRYFLLQFLELQFPMALGALICYLVVRLTSASSSFAAVYRPGTHLFAAGDVFFLTVPVVAWMIFLGHGWRHGLGIAIGMIAPVAMIMMVGELTAVDYLTWLLTASYPAMSLGMTLYMIYHRYHFTVEAGRSANKNAVALFYSDYDRKEQITMNTNTKQVSASHKVQVPGIVIRAGYFIRHFLEMCLAMCIGGITLNILFFLGASQVGYPNLLERFPEFSLLVIGINLALPMTAWMRFRGHDWRSTLEMASTSVILPILLIGAGWLGIVPEGSRLTLLKILACPIMIIPMLFRLGLYSAHHSSHKYEGHVHHADGHSGYVG